MLVLEAPVVLGWKTWCDFERKYEVAAFARSLNGRPRLRTATRRLAHVIFGAVAAGARIIATSVNPDVARAEVQKTIDRLITGLR